MTNHQKLEALMLDVFLLDPSEYSPELSRDQVDTWDSLGVVSLAVGVQEVFGYHMTPDEATGVRSVADLVTVLEGKGVGFDASS